MSKPMHSHTVLANGHSRIRCCVVSGADWHIGHVSSSTICLILRLYRHLMRSCTMSQPKNWTLGDEVPQVSRRWGWSHLDRLLQGTANSSSLINLIQYLDLYEDATVFWFHLLVLQGEGYNIGFGTCTGKVLPALPWANISSLQFMESRWSQRSSCAESTKLRSLVCLKPSYGNWILGVVFLECGKGNWSLSLVQ